MRSRWRIIRSSSVWDVCFRRSPAGLRQPTTIEVWTTGGLVTFYLLFVMELKTRRLHFAGCTVNPTEKWTKQQARELTKFEDGFLKDHRYLIMDRDTKFYKSFRSILKQADVEPVILQARSPNLSSHLERFFGSLKSERLHQMIFFTEASLRRAVGEYLKHYHGERNHPGLGNDLIEPVQDNHGTTGEIECRERLGGLPRYYHRRAA